VIVKPDGVQRGLVGEVIKRLEQKGLTLVGLKMVVPKQEQLAQLYSQHRDKPFYSELVDFMSSGPSVVMVVEGIDAAKVVRNIVGATNGREAQAGTIRGDYSMSIQNNVVHASESRQAAEREIGIFFNQEELVSYEPVTSRWVYAEKEL
jgi:nucleoside-diphosphate kinase